MDKKKGFVYSVSLKEANAMDELDKQFLKELLLHRMEVHYHRMSNEKTYHQKKEEMESYMEMEKQYQKVLSSLSEADREVIKTYVDEASDKATNETENYYRCGFQDGLQLMGSLIRYYIR